MNRASRRRFLREEKEKQKRKKRTYVMTDETLDTLYERDHKGSQFRAMAYAIGIIVEMHHEEYDWEQSECQWLAMELLRRYNEAPPLKEVVKRFNELTGLRLEMDADYREEL